ncbi:hypothetical protein [Chryseobacterium arthrosphaerae]|uniref:hypothetical protein n=1 Tax=Chryseobacterium arthrosphaerae TaxID=651561 RepID=UPI0031CF6D0F
MHSELLNDWRDILQNSTSNYRNLIEKLADVSRNYNNRKKVSLDVGYNIFTIISDYYYRENFHSDIIKSFIENERDTTFPIFLKMINLIRNQNEIKKSDFSNFSIFREKERIDILIVDDYSKKAIIIENKINNAADTNRQLPKYYDKISENYEVVAIVYLTLNTSKTPHKLDWSDEEIKQIENLLVIVPSMSNHSANLLDHFLNPSILEVKEINLNSTIRQYTKLIQYINHNSMDSINLKKFRDEMLVNDNLETAISIKNMLNDLPEYLAIRIEEKYNQHCYPFKNVWRYKNTTTVFDALEFNDMYLKLDIQCDMKGYKAIFWNPKIDDFNTKEKFQHLESLNEFIAEPDRITHIYKYYNFNEEDELFKFINNLLEELKLMKES